MATKKRNPTMPKPTKKQRIAIRAWCIDHWRGDCACHEMPCEHVDMAEAVMRVLSNYEKLIGA